MHGDYQVFLGLDVGKDGHHAIALNREGKRLHDAALVNTEAKLRQVFDKLAKHGPVLVLAGQPASIGTLPAAVARACGQQVAYRPGLATLLELGDGNSFATPGHLAAYAGLAPVTRRSGSTIRGEHPARGGNKQLKRAFFLAAFAALADPVSRAYYDRKRAQGKRHNAALICLARRRCDVLFAMLRDKIPTNQDPSHPSLLRDRHALHLHHYSSDVLHCSGCMLVTGPPYHRLSGADLLPRATGNLHLTTTRSNHHELIYGCGMPSYLTTRRYMKHGDSQRLTAHQRLRGHAHTAKGIHRSAGRRTEREDLHACTIESTSRHVGSRPSHLTKLIGTPPVVLRITAEELSSRIAANAVDAIGAFDQKARCRAGLGVVRDAPRRGHPHPQNRSANPVLESRWDRVTPTGIRVGAERRPVAI
ncbi:hypothetical protein Asi03nite_26490 [Actinoplanes siamensis]|uniref:Transposase IS116/IS110/IS902 C-terminal domain-containing protein n=1 Tax=Actinoplanes siamensis TaxID=1223317 RepID=A0A919N680_9ACTN|nr:hypothetical protein Asi03nite_26490 [Actinoplanes siamensis]